MRPIASRVLLSGSILCAWALSAPTAHGLDLQRIELTDDRATTATVAFYANLMKLADGCSFAFGQQGATHMGVGWTASAPYDRSDIQSVTGHHPAVDGQNFAWAVKVDTLPGSDNPKPGYPGEPLYVYRLNANAGIAEEVTAAVGRGQMVTFHFNMGNPDAESTGDGSDNDTKNPHPERGSLVKRCLPAGYGDNATDGDLHPVLKSMLDSFALLMAGDGAQNQGVGGAPILLRFWHEWNFGIEGDPEKGKWWGASSCSGPEFIDLWRFTADYLCKTKGLHNLLFVWAPSLNVAGSQGDAQAAEACYFSRYPGDDYVDVLAGDAYHQGIADPRYDNLRECLPFVIRNSQTRNKVPALAETGHKTGLQKSARPEFWVSQWLRPLFHDVGMDVTRLAYVASWTNRGGGDPANPSFFTTYPKPGEDAWFETEFIEFCKDPSVDLMDTLPDMYACSQYVFPAGVDADVSTSPPDDQSGSSTELRVGGTGGAVWESYLRFTVSDIPAGKTVVGSWLRIHTKTGDGKVTARAVADTMWSQEGIAGNNRPAMGATLRTLDVRAGRQEDFLLSGYVTRNGTFCVGLQGQADAAQAFHSRESANPPQLIVVAVDSPSANHRPLFASSAIRKTDAAVNQPYRGTLADAASDADPGATLTFEKLWGPPWLTISPDGAMSGTPSVGEAGANSFTARVRDQFDDFDVARIEIVVAP